MNWKDLLFCQSRTFLVFCVTEPGSHARSTDTHGSYTDSMRSRSRRRRARAEEQCSDTVNIGLRSHAPYCQHAIPSHGQIKLLHDMSALELTSLHKMTQQWHIRWQQDYQCHWWWHCLSVIGVNHWRMTSFCHPYRPLQKNDMFLSPMSINAEELHNSVISVDHCKRLCLCELAACFSALTM